jgi:glycine/D-amino acid oxidase-like deaminating enzyme
LTRSGGLVLAHPDSPFLSQTRESARRFEIGHENLSNAAVVRRFPLFQIDQLTEAYYEPEAGYVRLEAAVRAQLQLARRHGAQLRLGEHVEEWAASADGVIVRTDDRHLQGSTARALRWRLDSSTVPGGQRHLRDPPAAPLLVPDPRWLRFDRHPEHDTVLIVSPCSGHGFKHSPAVGEAVAQWVTG